MEIEIWPIDRPKPYHRNPRIISQKTIEKVGNSIKQFGWRQPLVCNEQDVILVGHSRQLGGKWAGFLECPVHVARGLSPAQEAAYRLADNRTNEARWDEDLLGLELLDLKGLDFDLSLTGFDAREIDGLLPHDSSGEDASPPVPEVAVSNPGDLWLCGHHRILCGDATAAGDVARLLRDDKPFLMATDPPYGVEYEPDWRVKSGVNKPWQDRAEGASTHDDRVDWSPAFQAFKGDVVYCWHAGRHASDVALALASGGFQIRNQIIWAKPSLVIGRGNYHWQHEPCWYAVRKGKPSHWSGDRQQSTLWSVPNMHRTQGNVDDGHTEHSAQKPVELFRRPIQNHTQRGEAVYDPFLGSGTALIAAEATERVCYGLEIEPRYVDVIVKRWENLTGKKATLA